MEEIKKILPTIFINTLDSKPIRIKQNIFIGDSVKISLVINEADELKQLHDGCTVNILYSDLEGKEVRLSKIYEWMEYAKEILKEEIKWQEKQIKYYKLQKKKLN